MSKYIRARVCLVVANLLSIGLPAISAIETKLHSVQIEYPVLARSSPKSSEEVEDPIFTDVVSDRTKKLKQFLDRGGSPDRYFYSAINAGAIDSVRMMIDRGAHVNLAREEGLTPVMVAARTTYRSGIKMTELLIEKGANVNARADKGSTALMFAAWGVAEHYQDEYVKVVRLLIKNGARVNVKNKMGDSPLSIAKSGSWKKIIAVLTKAGAKF
jgi:uncharacterized protein